MATWNVRRHGPVTVGIAAGLLFTAWRTMARLDRDPPVIRATTESGVLYRFRNFSVIVPGTWRVIPERHTNERRFQACDISTRSGTQCQVGLAVWFVHARPGMRPDALAPDARTPRIGQAVFGSRRIGGLPGKTMTYQYRGKRGVRVVYEWLVDRGEFWLEGVATWPAGKRRCRDEVLGALDSLKVYPP